MTKLCPNCPFKHWISLAKQNLASRQYTRTTEQPTAFKICMELRRIAAEHGLKCPYYRNETLEIAIKH